MGMILAIRTFLATIPRWLWIGLAIAAAVFAVLIYLGNRDDKNRTIGATEQRNVNLESTLDQGRKADAAADKIKRDADAARAQCMLDARNPADC